MIAKTSAVWEGCFQLGYAELNTFYKLDGPKVKGLNFSEFWNISKQFGACAKHY